MSGYIDFPPSKRCYNLYESYGEICVGCGCCSSTKVKAAQARLELHMRLLKHYENFDLWYYDDPELLALQKYNVAENIKYNKEQIARYEAIIGGNNV